MNASAANLALVQHVAMRLGALRERVVFLGGATIALLITDTGSAAIRATDDVDVIVEVSSYGEYQHDLRNELVKAGFREDSSPGAPRCRWIVDGVKVDVMPTDASVLGFSNRWYPAAITYATSYTLPNDIKIRLIAAPYLLATKIEAFHGRGDDDYLGSHDMEDIVTLVDGRPSLVEEIANAEVDLRAYLAKELSQFLNNDAFVEALEGHVLNDAASQARVPLILKRLREMTRGAIAKNRP